MDGWYCVHFHMLCRTTIYKATSRPHILSEFALLALGCNMSATCQKLVLLLAIAAAIFLSGIYFVSFRHFTICSHAHSAASCLSVISREIIAGISPISRDDLLHALIRRSISGIMLATEEAHVISSSINGGTHDPGLDDCMELFDLSLDRLKQTRLILRTRSQETQHQAQSWLSGVLTNHATCLDGLWQTTKSIMKDRIEGLMALSSTSLAVMNSGILSQKADESFDFNPLRGPHPSWLSSGDRMLLDTSGNEMKPNIMVAKDGSGNYKTIQEAINSVPDKAKTRYIIYVKRGTYKEQVEIGKKKRNVMLVGDGMEKTIITGSLNVVDGSTTFRSATVAVVGDGFIAQDIWFQNSAGPEKHQAVALRVGADTSVINRCKIDGYQDTLYAHSLRQFYRDCMITGTVDFIFGNAAVVLQNCRIIARRPMEKQSNMITAQGRIDPNQNTGTSIHNCQVIASEDLSPVKGSIRTYLGRPWKEYSRTVVMQSYLDDHIDSKGWSEWSGDFALQTLYYGEYLNRGPGAGTGHRVKWHGYHLITDPDEARKFTVAELIQGGQWLKETGAAYTEGLEN